MQDVRIYIATDMEGVSGIWQQEQVQPGRPEYEQARPLLCGDVNAAIEGAFAGGATQVVVLDGHGSGSNLLLEQMDSRALYEAPARPAVLPSLDSGFAGLMKVGAHARAGTLAAFLDHTQSSQSWFRYLINETEAGELAQCAAYAGHYGVPLIMVSGDQAACEEAKALVPGVVTAAVKVGLTRQRARCLHPRAGRDLIRQAAEQAVRATAQPAPWRPGLPITLTLTLYRTDMADNLMQPGVERVDARTVRKVVPTALEVYW